MSRWTWQKKGPLFRQNDLLTRGRSSGDDDARQAFDLELQLKDMSEAGIDVSVLSCLLGWNASLDECRLINNDLAKVQAKYLGKFVGLAQAPVLEGEEALQEIERAIRRLSLKGVTSTSQIKGVSLDSPKLYGLYEKLCELDVPLFVHPALVPIGYELLQDYDLPRVLGRGHRSFRRRYRSCEGPASRQRLSLRYAQALIRGLL